MLSASYVGHRLAQIVPTLILAVVLVFLLAHLLPGDPSIALLGERATNDAVERTRQALGVDRPILEQFGLYVRNLLSGDLGRSMILRVPVSDLIWQRLPVTALLTAIAALLAGCIAVPFALLSALHRDRPLDILVRGVFQLGVSMPVFYIGLVLLIVLAAGLGWFPVGGFGENFLDDLYHLILPALTLAMSLSAILMRNLRASLIEVLGCRIRLVRHRQGAVPQARCHAACAAQRSNFDGDTVRPTCRHPDWRCRDHRNGVRDSRTSGV